MRGRPSWTPAIVFLLGCAALSCGVCVVAQTPSASSLQASAQRPHGLFQACYEDMPDHDDSDYSECLICILCPYCCWLCSDANAPTAILEGNVQVAPIKASGYTVEECATLVAAGSWGDMRNDVPGMVKLFTLSNNNTVCAGAGGLARQFRLKHKAMVAGTEAMCPPATGLKVYELTFITDAQKTAFLQGDPAAQLTSTNSITGGRRMLGRVMV